ncbi:hypothetical protein [Metabacillus litoralis]|uniref:hypothetical protein n=1 Tax=Metabacillus litoralis TaxID=152268 RepID=UPI00203C4065|nr:hypothetical protein [Metabacillus litoralis]MCM3411475.1 hypothetical protein [Metabacillus litoralis]
MTDRKDETMNGVSYSLEVNVKSARNSFDYGTMNKAREAYDYLLEKYSEYRISKPSISSRKDFVQLSISEVITRDVPSNFMASFVPEDFFTEDIYSKMLEDAIEYHESQK